MADFKLDSTFKPTGDQPQAIEKLTKGLAKNRNNQVLLGVTGSGKTFTIANVVANINKPSLVISHNKTLAAQLYQEFRDFFPKNAVSYFVSYYDYYQPEAYVPSTDTYIEKETEINEEIDKLRLSATTNLLTRKDTLVVASVSCIYNIGSPKEYGNFVLEIKKGMLLSFESIFARLASLQYSRSDFGFHRGTFRVRGNYIDIFPAYDDMAIRMYQDNEKIGKMQKINPLDGLVTEELEGTVIYPAKHYMTNPNTYKDVFVKIREDLGKQVTYFKKQNKLIEAQRIEQRVNYDLEMIEALGYVNGIENYSRYFDGRNPGDPPYSLLDYYTQTYGDDWLLVIDESHMTVPQIRGMYNGDRSRKQTLIDFGFRLPASLDNRPLTFVEFNQRKPNTIYVSATPADYEVNIARETDSIVEQLIRPTGLIDPPISIRKSENQIPDLISEINKRVAKKERVLVVTLTKRNAEDLTTYLKEKEIRVNYLHSDILTLDRSDILDQLRIGEYDVIVGINLLREGLDLPEVSLVAILDADKEGFLRSDTSLIQTMGRAARNSASQVILYADRTTDSMKRAIVEVTRRRNIQLEYNKKHRITPATVIKPIRKKLIEREKEIEDVSEKVLLTINKDDLVLQDKKKIIKTLTLAMKEAAADLDFELATKLRDKIKDISI
ncbi:excinuclease ABC subunit UvrB [Candidatus Gottesmanbacteria bacterium]|nr:excinuclease ABC subunit UvrB [Candidatus Gottesmanbacteria bacterium]